MNIAIEFLLWVAYLILLYILVFWLLSFLDYRDIMKKESRIKLRIKKFPLVTIIVPAYNEENTITETIKSVLNLDYPFDKLELIVVNDGSTDSTKKKMVGIINKNKERNIIFIDQENQGKAKSLNNALEKAKGELFACLDADSIVDPKTLTKMVNFYQKNPNLVIATPAMRVKNPKTLFQKFQRIEYISSMFISRIMGHLDMIYVAPGPFSLYRTDIIKKLGGFDVGNLTEDQEIAYRVQKHNYSIRQCYNAYVYTNSPKNVKALYKQRNRWFKGSLLNIFKYKELFFNKKYGDFGMLQIPMNLITYFLSVCTIFFFGYFALNPLFKEIHYLYIIKFDIINYLKSINISFNILELNLGMMFMASILFFASLFIFYLAHRNTNENVRKHGLLHLIPYFFMYYTLLSVVSIIVLLQLVLGFKQKW
jgi:cellulose synthase/poly-beta-1,6-N-acetylglucosamine synthase-like glycosyltransferase